MILYLYLLYLKWCQGYRLYLQHACNVRFCNSYIEFGPPDRWLALIKSKKYFYASAISLPACYVFASGMFRTRSLGQPYRSRPLSESEEFPSKLQVRWNIQFWAFCENSEKGGYWHHYINNGRCRFTHAWLPLVLQGMHVKTKLDLFNSNRPFHIELWEERHPMTKVLQCTPFRTDLLGK